MYRLPIIAAALLAAACAPQGVVAPAEPPSHITAEEASCLARIVRPDSDLTVDIRRLNNGITCEERDGSLFAIVDGKVGETRREQVESMLLMLARILPDALDGTADAYVLAFVDRFLPGTGRVIAGVPGARVFRETVVETAGVLVQVPGAKPVIVCVAGLTAHRLAIVCRASDDGGDGAETLLAKGIIERELSGIVW